MRSLYIQSGLRLGVFSAAFLLAFSGLGADRQVVKGHLPPEFANLTAIDRLPPGQELHLAINLPLRNQDGLNKLIGELYDPASPSYHHFLNPAQFTAAYGATEKDYQALIDFAKSSGFKVTATHPNRLLLEVTAPVETIEHAFHVNMRVYPHPTEQRNFYSPDAEPSLDLDVPVLFIAGLSDYQIPRPLVHAQPMAQGGGAKSNSGSSIDSTYAGLDFRSAYVPGVSLTGTGQSVGLLEFDSYNAVDISEYFGDPATGISNLTVNITNAVLANMTGYPQSGETEVALDIDMAIDMAPGLSKVVVYEAPNSTSYADVLLDAMADDNICAQLSCSWSGFFDAGVASAFLQMQTQGQSFFVASGDSGEYPSRNSVPSPCGWTNVTSVGGTTLSTTGPQGSWTSEVVWSWYTHPWEGLTDAASSGGMSTNLQPFWQQAVSMTNNGGSSTYRNLPDVSMVADQLSWYTNGIHLIGGGTSAAAPLWAAFTALANQYGAAHGKTNLGFMNYRLYAIGESNDYFNAFHDITSGNNTNRNSHTKFLAETGFDLCTGWGSPNGSNLINALLPGLSQLSPTVTWSAPGAMVYGTALGGSQLNATANVAGTFAYTPAAGTFLNAGTNMLSVVFTPTDNYDYESETTFVAQVVSRAPLSVTASNATRVYGQANPVFAPSYGGFANGDTASALSGNPSLTTAATATSSVAGNPYTIVVSAGTLAASNYTFNFSNGQMTITAATSSNAVASSANPSLFGSNILFTATVTAVSPGSGTPTGTVQFYADGAALGTAVTLAGGVASLNTAALSTGLHSISNHYSGDGNFLGSGGSLGTSQVVESMPNAANVTLASPLADGAKISVAGLLAQDSDPGNEALSLVSAGPASTNGGSVGVSNNWVFYTPPAGAASADAFPYTIQNTQGLQATGNVLISVATDSAQSQNIQAVVNLGNNTNLVQFQGIPGYAYKIQYTATLESPSWLTLGTNTSGSAGAFQFTDTNASGTRFYRSTYP